MRITLEKKQRTRQQLLQVAADLFRAHGFSESTTRQIAKKAKLASGTMFNYFESKEELALALVVELAAQAHQEFAATRRLAGTMDEWLFTLVATELRHLNPMRGYLKVVLNRALDPAANKQSNAAAMRKGHLHQVHDVLSSFGIQVRSGPPGWEQLYWSLYLGVLTFWSSDSTSNQEATMALLDRAIGMFMSQVRYWPSAG